MASARHFIVVLLLLLFANFSAPASTEKWVSDLEKIPFLSGEKFLNESNSIPLIFQSFRKSGSISALAFLPGATDEFYFFKRAEAKLPPGELNLLQVCQALTNQTYIRMRFNPPSVIFHTSEDPLEPSIEVKSTEAAVKLKRHSFQKKFLYSDKDWEFTHPALRFYCNMKIVPEAKSTKANHFFRPSIVGFDLTVWETLEVFSLASKTQLVVDKKKITFSEDPRFYQHPPLDGIRTFKR